MITTTSCGVCFHTHSFTLLCQQWPWSIHINVCPSVTDSSLVTSYEETDKMWNTLYDNIFLFTWWYWSGPVRLCFVVSQWLWIRAARGRELSACLLVQSLLCVQKLQPGSKLPQQHRVRIVRFILYDIYFPMYFSSVTGKLRYGYWNTD